MAELKPKRNRKSVAGFLAGFSAYGELLGRLGKYKTGKSRLTINRLADVDLTILRKLVRESVAHLRSREKAQGA